MLEHPDRPVRRRRLDAQLQVDLVETQRGDAGAGHWAAAMRFKFAHGLQRRQSGQVLRQVPQRDQRVGLAGRRR